MSAVLKVPTIFTAVDKFSAHLTTMGKNATAFATKVQGIAGQSQRFFSKIGAGADGAFNRIVNLRNAAGVLFAVMAAKKGFDLVGEIANRGDDIDKNSRLVNLNAQAYQKLHFAAMRENVSAEALDKSLSKLNRNVGDLQMNQGSLYTNLKKTNPALLKQLKAVKTNEEAFSILSGVIAKAPNQLQKTALAAQFFGRGGVEMLKLLEVGPDGIAALSKEAEKLGLVLGPQAIADAAKFADVHDNFNTVLLGLKNTIGVALMPVISDLLKKFMAWVSNNRELIKVKVAEFANKIGKLITFLVKNIDKIVLGLKIFIGLLLTLKTIAIGSEVLSFFSSVVGFLPKILPLLTGLGSIVMNWVIPAFQFLGTVAITLGETIAAAFVANPVGLIIAAVVALIALVYVIVQKWNDWGAALSLFLGPLGLVISLIQSLRRNWEMVKNAFKTDGILAGFKAIGKVILDAMIMPLQQLLGLVAKFTGAKWATKAVADLGALRNYLGVNTTTDEKGNPLNKLASNTKTDGNGNPLKNPAVNPKLEQQKAMANAVQTNNINKNVTFDFKNLPKGVNISENGQGMQMPALGSTFKL